jgi:cysteine desulfurase
VTFLPVDSSGNLDVANFIRALRPDTLLVTIMHANNETGVVFPIENLSRLVKETQEDIVFHTDATQSVGKLPISLQGNFKHVDLLSFSGHKMHAPKGVGALFIRKGTPCRPLLIGGHQEGGRRAGTENVPYIAGLAKACELAKKHLPDEERVAKLRDRLQAALLEKIPYLEVNGANAPRLPNTLNVACHYIEGEGILHELSEHGICASSGSACTSGSLEPSHVLKAMAVPFTAMHGSVRFSLSTYTTDEEVDHIIDVFPHIVEGLRKASPYWDSDNNKPREDGVMA